jgi:transposase InsO family protein
VVGWAMADHLRAELALAALEMALAQRAVTPGGLIHHSDRGVQGGFKWWSQHDTLLANRSTPVSDPQGRGFR